MPGIEQLLFQRLFTGDSGLAQAVYVAGMFAILIWRREAVVNWWLFRTSYLLYGASLIAPPILTPLIGILANGGNRNLSGINADGQVFSLIFTLAVGPLLLAAAVICGLGSMIPRLSIAPPLGPPPKHPLD
jgi:hypothetical protein